MATERWLNFLFKSYISCFNVLKLFPTGSQHIKKLAGLFEKLKDGSQNIFALATKTRYTDTIGSTAALRARLNDPQIWADCVSSGKKSIKLILFFTKFLVIFLSRLLAFNF